MAFPTHIVAAAGYVFDREGRLLLGKTGHRGWDVTGGQVEAGESLEEGVLREIYEESGVRASIRCLAAVYSNVSQNMWHDGLTPVPTKVIFDFICDYESGEPTPIDGEMSELMWTPGDKAADYITPPVLVYRLGNVLRFDGRVLYASYKTRPAFTVLSERYI